MGSEKVRLSAAAAAYVKNDAPAAEKIKAARGEIPVSSAERAIVLIFLLRDQDSLIRSTALATLKNMPDETLCEIALSTETHPRVLDLLARLHSGNAPLLSIVAAHPNAEPQTLEFLKALIEDVSETEEPATDAPDACIPPPEGEVNGEADEWTAPEEEDFKSKYQIAQVIGISEKIKFAMTGDKEWRSIMLKDSNKLVSIAVLKNPRITEPEILAIAKSSMVNEEIVRLICQNKDWVKNYQIRKALVENHRTPLPTALRFMATLTEKDLIMLSKSKNVSTVIATQARKTVMALQKRR